MKSIFGSFEFNYSDSRYFAEGNNGAECNAIMDSLSIIFFMVLLAIALLGILHFLAREILNIILNHAMKSDFWYVGEEELAKIH